MVDVSSWKCIFDRIYIVILRVQYIGMLLFAKCCFSGIIAALFSNQLM